MIKKSVCHKRFIAISLVFNKASELAEERFPECVFLDIFSHVRNIERRLEWKGPKLFFLLINLFVVINSVAFYTFSLVNLHKLIKVVRDMWALMTSRLPCSYLLRQCKFVLAYKYLSYIIFVWKDLTALKITIVGEFNLLVVFLTGALNLVIIKPISN